MSTRREQFQRRIEELVAQFEKDVDREWITRRYPKRMRDNDREVYEVPALYLQRGPLSVLLDPIGDDVPGAEATADLYQMPTYDPAASVFFEGGRWIIQPLFRPDPKETFSVVQAETLPLSAESINQILNLIAEHAIL